MEELWNTLALACKTDATTQRPVLIAVDRDGTLVPITDNPDDAIVPEAVKDRLRLLASFSCVTVAAVSARPVEKLALDFGEGALILAGNYGLEIQFPDGQWDIQAFALDARPDLMSVKQELLNDQFAKWGVLVEDHLYTLCAHWHLTPEEARPYVHRFIRDLCQRFDSVKVIHRPTSYEFFPQMDWDKGHAMERINRDLHGDYFPIYFGDSDADECAFEWVNKHGGVSVRVGEFNPLSVARFHVPSPTVVHALLGRLSDLLIARETAHTGSSLKASRL